MPSIEDARRTYSVSLGFVMVRDELPRVLNERRLFGCGVEVGVQKGAFSEMILENWQGSHLISIDPWVEFGSAEYVDIANVSQQEQNANYEATIRRLRRFTPRSSVWRMTSVDASRRVPHHSLDFAYIDAQHHYQAMMEDLDAWYDRVRPGGIIAGHDYLDTRCEAGDFEVRTAVDEFFGARDIQVHSTHLDTPFVSWLAEVPLPSATVAVQTSMPPLEKSA